MVEKLFKFFSENEILPMKDVTDKCIKILETQNFLARYTRMDKK